MRLTTGSDVIESRRGEERGRGWDPTLWRDGSLTRLSAESSLGYCVGEPSGERRSMPTGSRRSRGKTRPESHPLDPLDPTAPQRVTSGRLDLRRRFRSPTLNRRLLSALRRVSDLSLQSVGSQPLPLSPPRLDHARADGRAHGARVSTAQSAALPVDPLVSAWQVTARPTPQASPVRAGKPSPHQARLAPDAQVQQH